jgi:carboxymethylenebutenolidase
MCHSDDSMPPSPPVIGQVAEHGMTTLHASDGNAFAAYRARPAGDRRATLVILPDVRGLHRFYQLLAVRCAEAGFDTVAMDYFGRTNGVSERDDSFDWQTEITKVRPDQVENDVAACIDRTGGGPAFTLGFCFGGSQSWRLGASSLPLAGCMGFYGKPAMVASVEPDITHPLLLLVAGSDAATPLSEFHDFDSRLTEAGRDHEMVVYDGAPHSFFDRSYGQWSGACSDAWQRILSFTSGVVAASS